MAEDLDDLNDYEGDVPWGPGTSDDWGVPWGNRNGLYDSLGKEGNLDKSLTLKDIRSQFQRRRFITLDPAT
jgi:hypothetical protein